MMNPVINMKNIRKTYATGKLEVEVLKGVDITVNKGDLVSIIGSSGSGKSTLMNIIGCLDIMTEGEYSLNGKDITSYTEEELSDVRNQNIGFIFQSFNLLNKLTAYENVELPLIYGGIEKKERHEMVMNALDLVGLSDRIKHSPNELSGGQQQRVAIARAIAGKPPLILADEPTGNLDSKSTEEIIKILLELNANGMTLVLITHNNEIANMAQKIINIKDGEII